MLILTLFACQATGIRHLGTSLSLENESSYWKRWCWEPRHIWGSAPSTRTNPSFKICLTSPALKELFISWSVFLRMIKRQQRQLLSLCTDVLGKKKKAISLQEKKKKAPQSYCKIKYVVVMAIGDDKEEKDQVPKLFFFPSMLCGLPCTKRYLLSFILLSPAPENWSLQPFLNIFQI